MKKGNIKCSENRKVPLFAEAGTLVDDDIYFFSSAYNLLYKVHIPDLTISIISHIPCDKVFAFEWFRKARYWKGKLIFVPSYAKKIWIYDLKERKWDSIVINYQHTRLKFWGAIIHQDFAFLFGVLYPVILKINLNDYSLSYLEIEHQHEQKEEGLFFTDAVKVGHMIFCPISISNQILQLNLDTLKYKWIQIGSINNKYSGIDCKKDSLWISPGENGKIVKWNGGLEWEEFEVPREIADRSYQFIGVICDKEEIRFLTQQDGESLEIINKGNKDQILLTDATKRYIHLERYENGTIVLMRSDGYIEVKWKNIWLKGICEIAYEDFKGYFSKVGLWNSNTLTICGTANEAEIFKVNDYIEIAANYQKKSDEFLVLNNFGTSIWKTVS